MNAAIETAHIGNRPLTEFELMLIARLDRIESRLPGAVQSHAVIPRSQAITYIGKRSTSAFDRWCAKNNVKPVACGRYSKAKLDLALMRESAGKKN